ncbi:STAS domain-containing protein [Dermatobacter hominis]|uniref:STAS domain-containing protein n=1 Tax=Dermatobacter hominis TaxID=2884263 RepID=UPI001D0F6CC6|nr:STAS domain-containing protein [Dermatobacter hominis]UDY37532.1 STAS domain-containing protein [Dermatobacter hominis]
MVTTEEVADLAVVRVDGELDVGSAPDLVATLESLLSQDDRRVVVDLTDCSFVDSRGSRALALTARDASGPPIGIVCPAENRRVHRVLELVGIVDLVEVHGDLDPFLASGR